MTMAWRKRIIRRASTWTGVNGNHFDTYKFIDVIFHSKADMTLNRPHYIYGAEGAVVGGSGSELKWIVRFINGTLKVGSPETSIQEIQKLTRKAALEMLDGKVSRITENALSGEVQKVVKKNEEKIE